MTPWRRMCANVLTSPMPPGSGRGASWRIAPSTGKRARKARRWTTPTWRWWRRARRACGRGSRTRSGWWRPAIGARRSEWRHSSSSRRNGLTAEKQAQAEREKSIAAGAKAEQEARTAAALRRRAVWLGVAFAAAVLLAIWAAYLFGDASAARNKAEVERKDAEPRAMTRRWPRPRRMQMNSRRMQMNSRRMRPGLSTNRRSAPAAVPQQGLLLAAEAYALMKNSELDLPFVEQALRDALNRPLGLPILAHPDGVQAVAFEPSGQWLATGGVDGTVSMWNMNDDAPEPVAVDIEPNGSINVLTFDATGRWLAVGDTNRTITLVDEARGYGVVAARQAHKGSVSLAAFSPNGRWLAATSTAPGFENQPAEHDLLLWDLQTLAAEPTELITPTLLSEEQVTALAFTVDGKGLVAATESGKVLAWDVTSTPAVTDPQRELESFRGAMFSPESGRLAGIGADDSLQARSMGDFEQVIAELGPQAQGRAGALSPDGNWLAAWTEDGEAVALWNLSRPEQPAARRLEAVGVVRVQFSPLSPDSQDSQWLALVTADNRVLLHNLARSNSELVALSGHEGTIEGVSFAADGKRVATASADGSVRVWQLPSSVADPTILQAESAAEAAAIAPNWQWAVMSNADGKLRLWNLEEASQKPTMLSGYAGTVEKAQFSGDGRWLAVIVSPVRNAAAMYLWDLRNPRRAPAALAERDKQIDNLAFSRDGKWLAAGSGLGRVLLWDLTRKLPLGILAPTRSLRVEPELQEGAFPPPVRSVAFSPDARWLAAGAGESGLLWDLHNLEQPALKQKHVGWVLALAFSHDGRWLASGSQGRTIRLWDLAQPHGEQQMLPGPGHVGAINALAFSDDSELLVSASGDSTARVWQISALVSRSTSEQDSVQVSGQVSGAVVLGGHSDEVELAVFDAGAWRLVTAAADNTVQMWDLQEVGKQSILLRGHTAPVLAAAFTPDGQRLATASADGTVRIWRVQRDQLAELACRMAGRNLAQAEWAQYVAGTDHAMYHKTCSGLPAHQTVLDPLLTEASRQAEAGLLEEAGREFELALQIEPSLGRSAESMVQVAADRGQAKDLVKQARGLAQLQDIEGAAEAVRTGAAVGP